MSFFSSIRFNRYYWYIYIKSKKMRGIKRIAYIFFSSLWIPLKHRFKIWDYVDEIKKNGSNITIKDGSVFFIPRCERDTIQKTIARDNYYYDGDNLDFLRDNYIPLNANILDIGANIGNHSVFFACQCGANRIYSFEPQKDIYEILKRNVEINKLNDRVVLYNKGVGEESGKARINSYNINNSGGTSIKMDSKGELEVITIDELDLPRIDFVKIDVEGFEFSVLKGSRLLLARDTPAIWIEIKEEHYKEVNDFLEKLGYSKVINKGEDYLYLPEN